MADLKEVKNFGPRKVYAVGDELLNLEGGDCTFIDAAAADALVAEDPARFSCTGASQQVPA